ncbi:unnamed protein product [Peronospora belbahrii]|uniref:Uncharacterized protein n=1 Tax=Peronospora belbahrii TaxID=622444 RepID=A0AAU9L969_9STRA|nr:unnamed protein product [Peronospora belbahrii]
MDTTAKMDEVQFTNLIFTLHPKSIDTWAYRRWLTTRLCESHLEDNHRQMFYNEQINVSSRLAEQKPRNYHAWSFRHWIVSRLPLDLMLVELNSMEHWCRMHITDHSGWNHRQHILNELAKKHQDTGNVERFLQNLILAELKLVSEIMASYLTHEALWCHRRYIIHRLLKMMLQRASSDLSFVLVVVSQVAKTLSDAKSESFEAAALSLSWSETIKILSNDNFGMSSMVHAILKEIEIAWKCGNQFSRRYAAWCLARLRVFFRGSRAFGVSDQDDALEHELSSLASSLHE